ncbi:integral peroxisomal membrane peroxin-domain-containing protein [Entophlyctis helioformis]|nr:integral peroxisomal membrane peroxin-domain-containing protein [Entophlyctis helioformis]
MAYFDEGMRRRAQQEALNDDYDFSLTTPGGRRASSSNSNSSSGHGSHDFVVSTFHGPTFCDFCSQLLWGLARQGEQCTECGYVAHRKCSPSVRTPCNPERLASTGRASFAAGTARPSKPFVLDESISTLASTASAVIGSAAAIAAAAAVKARDEIRAREELRAELRSEQRAAANKSGASLHVVNDELAADSDRPAAAPSLRSQPVPVTPMMAPPPTKPAATAASAASAAPAAKTSLADDMFANVTAEVRKAEEANRTSNPPLSLATLLKSNNKFVARQGPLIWINETAMALITWRNPANTLGFMLGYVVLCSYPILVPIAPLGGLLYVIAVSYKARADTLARGETPRLPLPPGAKPKIVLTNAQYLAHLQHIQNTMTNMSDLYDAGFALAQYLDWSDPDRTLNALYAIVAAMVGYVVFTYLVPLNIILLWAGLFFFVANTAVAKAASTTLRPVLLDNLQRGVDSVLGTMHAVSLTASTRETVLTVSVFENQRWWAGLGFVPVLLHTERAAWSDVTGDVRMTAKEMYELPAPTTVVISDPVRGDVSKRQTWEWLDEDWTVDLAWPVTLANGPAGLASSSRAPLRAPDGWQFCDQVWASGRDAPVMGSFTRRRKWVRRMRMVLSESDA